MKCRYPVLLLPIVLILLAAEKNVTQDAAFNFLGSAENNSQEMIQQGRHIFRFATFGDQEFWGGKLNLHQTINGVRHWRWA